MATVVRKRVSILCVALLAVARPPLPIDLATAQDRPHPAAMDSIPPDTFADGPARRLIRRARQARGTEAAGLDSYEATITERIYVGLSAPRFRRERGLFLSESVARVRWAAEGKETYRWLGSRQEIPIVGGPGEEDGWSDEGDRGGEDPDDLIPLDPTGDRLMLGGEAFLHPLADTAARHYRYASGDTIRIILPSSGREITLAQVRVEPRRADFGLLAGAIWFDAETAALVRGAFRPARDFNLDIDEPEDAEEVPGFMKPITVSVDHMIVDYALQELRWWLPWRVRFEGEGRAGRLLRVPVVVEASVADYALNEADTLDIAQEDLPAGWERRTAQREGEDGRAVREVIILPPHDSLRASPLLSDAFFSGTPLSFSRRELDRMRDELDRAFVPQTVPSPSLSGLTAFRFNRVEGLSGGLRHRGPVAGSLTGWGEIRLGIADRVPNVEAGLREETPGGAIHAESYYRLQSANDWGNPLNLESSVNALLFGYDYGQYYRAGGVSLGLDDESGRVRYQLRAFAETHRSESKQTDLSLANLLGRSDPPPNIDADEMEIAGLEAHLRVQAGVDPEGLVSTAWLWGETGLGDSSYARLAGDVTASHPLVWRLAASLEISAGTTFGGVPTQRLYYLGGPQTVRAFEPGQIAGSAFWLARAEVALGYPAVRFVTFTDFGWAGDRSDFSGTDPGVAVGAGVSALDGLLRADMARGVHGPGALRWQFHLYLDALL